MRIGRGGIEIETPPDRPQKGEFAARCVQDNFIHDKPQNAPLQGESSLQEAPALDLLRQIQHYGLLRLKSGWRRRFGLESDDFRRPAPLFGLDLVSEGRRFRFIVDAGWEAP